MSYVHCPSCAHAYNLVKDAGCPRCRAEPAPRVVTVADAPAAELVVAAVHLAKLLARATPADRLAARASLMLVRDRIAASFAPPPLARLSRLVAAAATVLLSPLG